MKMILINYSFTILVLSKIILFCFWFCVGIYLYNKISNSFLKGQLNNLTFFEMVLVFNTIFVFIMFIKTIFVDYILSLYISDIQFNFLFMVEPNSTESVNSFNTESVNQSANTESVNQSAKYDGIIKSTALATGMQIAKKVPSIGAKNSRDGRFCTYRCWSDSS